MIQNNVKNVGLAEQGEKNIKVAEDNMKALLELRKEIEEEKPFEGKRISMALHITKETAVLVRTLEAGGAKVAIAGCNPLSTQDDVAAALAVSGTRVFGKKGESDAEYYENINNVISIEPHITIDDGGDLINSLYEKDGPGGLSNDYIGGCEETTTGIIRLKAMEKDEALKHPMIAVNDNDTKHLMDNYYGTGQSTLDGVMRAMNFMFAGKIVVVSGYGSCGKGVAMRARGLGAKVIVTEVDAFRALQAHMDGHDVMKMIDAAPMGDLFITVTGDRDIVTLDHVNLMKDGAIICNSGHFDCEIDIANIGENASEIEEIRPFVKAYHFRTDKTTYQASEESFTTKKVYILADGRLVNLAAAEGHPSDVMSLSFCGQVLACKYLVENAENLKAGVHSLPPTADEKISRLQLKAKGISIDTLTPEQIKYLNSWKVGT